MRNDVNSFGESNGKAIKNTTFNTGNLVQVVFKKWTMLVAIPLQKTRMSSNEADSLDAAGCPALPPAQQCWPWH